jgi:hypothetical protein
MALTAAEVPPAIAGVLLTTDSTQRPVIQFQEFQGLYKPCFFMRP